MEKNKVLFAHVPEPIHRCHGRVEKDSVLLHKVQESMGSVEAKKQKGTEFSFCTHKEKFYVLLKGEANKIGISL